MPCSLQRGKIHLGCGKASVKPQAGRKQASWQELETCTRASSAPRRSSTVSVPRPSDAVITRPKPYWTLYDPMGIGVGAAARPGQILDAQDARVTARHECLAVAEGDVLRRRVGGVNRARRRRAAAPRRRSPRAARRVRCRRRARRSRASASAVWRSAATSTTATCSEVEPRETHSRRPEWSIVRWRAQPGSLTRPSIRPVATSRAVTLLRPESVTNACRPSGCATVYLGSTRPAQQMTHAAASRRSRRRRPRCDRRRRGRRRARSRADPASVRIERTTRNEPRSTTASRASASHVTRADGSGAVRAARRPNGAAAASARNSERFTLSLRLQPRQGSRTM